MVNRTTRREFLKRSARRAALIAAGSFPEAAYADGKPIIVLDAGHGMSNATQGRYDPGAVYGGVQEADIVLDQVRRVRKILSQEGFDVRATRLAKETECRLEDRDWIANNVNADALISFHVNDFKNDSAQGVRAHYYPGNSKEKNSPNQSEIH